MIHQGIAFPIHFSSYEDAYYDFNTGLLQPRLIITRLACAHHELDIVGFEILHAHGCMSCDAAYLDAEAHGLVVWGAHDEEVVVLPTDGRRLVIHF